MKSKILLLLLLLCFIITGCSKKKEDQFLKDYMNIVDENHVFQEIKYNQLLEVLKEGTHLIYFGFPECPWCQQYVYYYNEYAKEFGIDHILYFNHRSIRTFTVTEDGPILHLEFQKIVELMGKEHLATIQISKDGKEVKNSNLEEESDLITLSWIYAPTLYLVRNGKVILQGVSTLADHNIIDGVLPVLTDVQKQTLKNNLFSLYQQYQS